MEISEYIKIYENIKSYDAQNRQDASDDLSFRAGDQWDAADMRTRNSQSRPTLVLSQIDQFVRKIAGQTRMHSPSLRVYAGDEASSPEVAEIIEGAIRDIERRSNAKAARMKAHEDQVTCGVGHYEAGFEVHPKLPYYQIKIESILDPLSVVWDPSAKELDRSDANFCFSEKKMPISEFKKEFKDKQPISFSMNANSNNYKYGATRYEQGENIVLVRYFEKYKKKHKFILTTENMQIDVTDMTDDDIITFQPIHKYSRDITHVRYKMMSGSDILEEIEDYPCCEIPIIPVIGEEIFTANGVYRQGLVRKMRESQKFYNYMMSTAMELMGQSTKSPYIGTNTMFQSNQEAWQMANIKAMPFLAYEPDPQAPGASPVRSMPPTQHFDFINGAKKFLEDMNGAAGVHDEALGKQTNAKSGVAIQARQQESAVATNNFAENLSYSMRQEGRILVSMIQILYHQERQLKIINKEGKETFVRINETIDDYDEKRIINDITYGTYEVYAEAGAGYASIKQDALTAIMEITKINPEILPFIFGDMVNLMEIPNAGELQEKIKEYTASKMQQIQGQAQPPMPQQQLIQQQG